MRPAIALVFLLVAGCSAPAATSDEAASSPPLVACALDPCTTKAIEGDVHEPWIAVDPADPLHVVAGGFGAGGDGPFAVATSFDGGATWALASVQGGGLAPDDPLAGYQTSGDIMLAFAQDGSILLAGLMSRGAGVPSVGSARDIDVALWRSTDGGLAFGDARILVDSTGVTTFTNLPVRGAVAGGWSDKIFLTVDRATGAVHMFWNAIGTNAPGVGYVGGVDVLAIRSDDDGATWSEPVRVAAGKYGASAAAHNGTLLVTYRNPGYWVARSIDAGATWGEPVELGDIPGPDTTWQAAPPALWEANGTLHAAIALASGEDGEHVSLARSVDGGATWSEPTSALPDAASTKRNPVLAVDPASGAGIIAAYAGLAEVGMSVWTAPVVDGVAGSPFLAGNVSAERYLFEYFGAASAGGRSYIAWSTEGAEEAPLLVAALRATS